ncbi:MAG: methylated-DNA--[protein]-cysteine S-methyltransferase, partial [Candidatus Dormibacteria bacterium]
GYSSPSRVYGQAAAMMGMTPAQYGKHGVGQHIRYASGNSTLGQVLVATTERGICSITLGESAAELEAQLQRAFSGATLKRDTESLAEMLATVLSQISEHPLTTALPLDVRATAFQQRVWQALQQIPRGQTASYAQVAAAIGQPTAVRAVARACAQNPVAILVPCHRVLGSNGKLIGYRWGIARKQQLLQIERMDG